MTRELALAKEIICAFLAKNNTGVGLYEIYEIKNGNKKLLLEHIKALASIFSVAYADLLKEVENDNKNES